MTHSISAGRAAPLGATVLGDGVNFAVFSDNATAMYVCLFDSQTGAETRLALPERTGGVWHGHIAGLQAGQAYGFRAHGPYRPDEGHRFNVNKLLLDPYARLITGHLEWHDALYGYDMQADAKDLSFDIRDSARWMPRCVVQDYAPDPVQRPGIPFADMIIYEAHLKGLTKRHPDVPDGGNFAAATSAPILDHLTKLGVTAIEFLPV